MAEDFNSVAGLGSIEQVIEKSKFIALVAPVRDMDEVEKHMKDTRRTFPNARHYVYAYRLYRNRMEKASDDGEPQGTGGRPVLDLLQHRQIWDAQIIVVRYFGGVLLGTGGLARAYRGTALLALDKVGIAKYAPHVLYTIYTTYPWYEQIKYGIRQKGWEIDKEIFEEKVSLNIYIPVEEDLIFEKWIDELTNKQVSREREGIVLRA